MALRVVGGGGELLTYSNVQESIQNKSAVGCGTLHMVGESVLAFAWWIINYKLAVPDEEGILL